MSFIYFKSHIVLPFSGITNFDLLGDFGAIEWLGNFQIVLFYNLVFGTTTALCLVHTVTPQCEIFIKQNKRNAWVSMFTF